MERKLLTHELESVSTTDCQHCGRSDIQKSEFNSNTRGSISPRSGHKYIPTMYRGRIIKLSILVIFSFFFGGMYLAFFKHPPPDVLLQMNMQSQESSSYLYNDFGASSFKKSDSKQVSVAKPDATEEEDDDDDVSFEGGKNAAKDEEDEEEEVEIEEEDEDNNLDEKDEAPEKEVIVKKVIKKDSVDKNAKKNVVNMKAQGGTGAAYWSEFLKEHKLVAIGAVFDKCEGDRIQIGTVVLQEDKEVGGVKSTTFFNTTFAEEITGGQFHIEVKYNGEDLYDNYWELCELEDELPEKERTFNCPIKAKHWSIEKDKHIPGYLPKGRFTTKAWAVDDNEKVIACGFSDFKL